MRRFGLTGFPLSHSFSAKYFSDKFATQQITDCEYLNFPAKEVSEIRYMFERDHLLCGLNVTIPHKKAILGILDIVEPTASAIGAVNVIKAFRKEANVTLKGFNTDVFGFRESLPQDVSERGGVALVLGSGGAASAVIHALRTMGFKVLIVSRKGEQGTVSYKALDAKIIVSANLIVNTTPLGMFPDTEKFPDLKYDHLTESTYLYDLIYNPAITQFMSEGIKRGCRVMNGLKMLELQAEKSWDIWNDNSV